jgi:hypothetical protein
MIVFTVPHATNVDGNVTCNTHIYCDTDALRVARAFSLRVPNSQLLIGDVNRTQMDLNRIESRYTTSFRSQLRDMSKQFVLDIHSYPQDEMWGLGFSSPAVFLVDDGSLIDLVKWNRVFQLPMLRGQGNDIMDEMTTLGIPSILLEVREGISGVFIDGLIDGFLRFLK